MTIYFLQKLNPPILPVLHEVINSKRLPNSSRSAKNSTSQHPLTSEASEAGTTSTVLTNPLFYNSDSNDDSDEDAEEADEEEEEETELEKDSIENFDIFKANLRVYLQRKTWQSTNIEGLGSLWLKLLAFYSIDFGFKKNFISIRNHDRVSKSEVKMYTKKMAIEDPFLLKQSLSRNLLTQTNKHVIYVISKACLYFVNVTRGLSVSGSGTAGEKIVEKLILDTGILEAKKRNNGLLDTEEKMNENEEQTGVEDEELNEDEIAEDIFELDNYIDGGNEDGGLFNGMDENEEYVNSEGRKVKLNKNNSLDTLKKVNFKNQLLK